MGQACLALLPWLGLDIHCLAVLAMTIRRILFVRQPGEDRVYILPSFTLIQETRGWPYSHHAMDDVLP